MNDPKRVPELDGIRGIAILLVMVFHFGGNTPVHPTGWGALVQQAIGFGWCGVDLFFVLSGFLITGILLDSRGAHNYFSVFYARRALRILPLYYLAVFVFFQVIPTLANRYGWSWTNVPATEQLWYWPHISNWHTAFHPLIYPQISHFWSLAIEEQFYLIWPFLVLICSRRRLLQVCIAVVVGCFVLRNLPPVQELAAKNPNLLYRLTPFRLDSLIFGAIGSLIVRDARWESRVRPKLRWVFLSGCGGIIAVLAAGGTSSGTAPMARFGFTALGIAFGAAILWADWNSGSRVAAARALRSGTLRSFGKYSYAMYIVHAPLSLVYVKLPGHDLLSILLSTIEGIVATYLVALLSWNCLERHFLKLRSRFPYQQKHLASSV